MVIPESAEGYAVDLDANRLHRRYADHAPGATRVRTVTGVFVLAGSGELPEPCELCFGGSAKTHQVEEVITADALDAGVAPRTRRRRKADQLVEEPDAEELGS